MALGISVYPGLENSAAENLSLIRRAARLGIKRLFTSLHIPETEKNGFAEELRGLLAEAKAAGMDVIADAAPETPALLGLTNLDPEALASLGIRTLRLDDGFSPEEIAALTKERGAMRYQLNASTLDEAFLTRLLRGEPELSRLDALHNFYPRENTGLSLRALLEKTRRLRGLGISVGAFVATRDGRKRAPIGAGLPTLELHRGLSVDLAARHLAALGLDDIFIGDALPTEGELASLASTQLHCVTLRAAAETESPSLRALFAEPFTARPDEARDAVRAAEGRARAKKIGCPLLPENTAARPFGAVTLDNEKYLRYAGELQIVKRPLPEDPRVNVVAHIRPEERFLIPCIRPGGAFRLLLDE